MPIVLGKSATTSEDVYLDDQARRQGIYVIGTTGTGKTTLLKSIAYQDMQTGDGLCVIDPHGDLIDELLECVPRRQRDRVWLFAPGDDDQVQRPLGLNIFDCNRHDPRETRRVASTIMDTLYRLFSYSWGPRMEELLRNSIYALLEQPDSTLLHLWYLLADDKFRTKVVANLKDPYQRQFWTIQYPRMSASARDSVELVGSSLNKISRFLADPLMRRVVAQGKSAFNLKQIMDRGDILFVNLSKGKLGEDNSTLLGAVLVNQILSAALQRHNIPPAQRRPFHLIVDEYQNFATTGFPVLQSEARKYAIDVIVAHQFRDQLDELNKGSTMNVANFIVLRTSGRDSYELASQFDNTPPQEEPEQRSVYTRMSGSYSVPATTPGTGKPIVQDVAANRRTYSDMQAETANVLSILNNHEAYCRLVRDGRTGQGIIRTQPFNKPADEDTAPYIRHRALNLGRNYESIDAETEGLVGDIEFVLPSDDLRDE